jgi:hypothetical protein
MSVVPQEKTNVLTPLVVETQLFSATFQLSMLPLTYFLSPENRLIQAQLSGGSDGYLHIFL